MDHKKDGMRYPAIDQLVSKTSSKYKLVIGAAIRARQITAGDPILIDKPNSAKPIGIALEEIYENKIEIR
ncbi:MAG: DNA-directed RNA polymerase subunit omega [Bacilli bacterium]|nr:DNA-directed RNA polymerase subunit omega [Bacilli bacterium]